MSVEKMTRTNRSKEWQNRALNGLPMYLKCQSLQGRNTFAISLPSNDPQFVKT